jgi:hypothetical protein
VLSHPSRQGFDRVLANAAAQSIRDVTFCTRFKVPVCLNERIKGSSRLSNYFPDALSHVYGQSTKRENGLENIKVTSSAWDTNIVDASGVSSPDFTNIIICGSNISTC